jgi:hypothetical protein
MVCARGWLSGRLVNERAIAGLRDWLVFGVRHLDPCSPGLFKFGQRFRTGGDEGGAGFQIGNIGDVSAVLVTVESIDVVILSLFGPFEQEVMFFHEL